MPLGHLVKHQGDISCYPFSSCSYCLLHPCVQHTQCAQQTLLGYNNDCKDQSKPRTSPEARVKNRTKVRARTMDRVRARSLAEIAAGPQESTNRWEHAGRTSILGNRQNMYDVIKLDTCRAAGHNRPSGDLPRPLISAASFT